MPISARLPTERAVEPARAFEVARLTLARVFGLALVLSLACTSVPARTALEGDLPALKAAIAEAEKADALGSSRVKELAGAVLKRELSSPAPADASSSDAFPDVSRCAPEVRSVLEDVASGSSDWSAPAALALIDAGYSAPRSGRAAEVVEAREALGPRAGGRRRALMLHGDVAVRLGALGAALEGAAQADAADVAALSEAARLDPYPEARELAIRALGHVGSSAAVQALIDVYASAAPEERRQIVLAWSLPASFAAGGGAELEALAAQGAGEPSVLAAIALVGHAESAALGVATLLEAIESEAAGQRLEAIAGAPWSDTKLRAAIGAARRHAAASTRVLALFRFVEAGEVDASVSQELAQLASDGATPVGAVARAALARSGKGDVKAALRVDLGARAADRRTLAALSLLALEDWQGAARALGDDSPRVRRSVACQVLAELEGKGGAPHAPPSVLDGAPPVVPLLLSETAG